MKKLFISVPMKNRTEDNIRKSIEKLHRIAEVVFDEELEVIPTYIEDKPPKDGKEAVWYLGKAIQKLAEADYFIGVNYSDFFKGCSIEHSIACNYGIKSYIVALDLFPDALDLEQNYYNGFAKRE